MTLIVLIQTNHRSVGCLPSSSSERDASADQPGGYAHTHSGAFNLKISGIPGWPSHKGCCYCRILVIEIYTPKTIRVPQMQREE